MSEDKILKLNSIDAFNRFFGVKTRNPMISVVNMSEIGSIVHVPKRIDIHSIICFDYDEEQRPADGIVSALYFYPPGQYGRFSSGHTVNMTGWAFAFDAKAINDTTFDNRIKAFSFFRADTSTIINLNREERDKIYTCMKHLDMELNHPIDAYTSRIMHARISVLMNTCLRYYDMNTHNNNSHKDIISRLNGYLDNYLRDPSAHKEIPTVASAAKALGLSPNYLGDMVRKHTQRSARNYISHFILQEAQMQLQYSTTSINDIAYNMGFKYPHHFTRVFKSLYGITPSEYRTKHRQ